MAMKKIEIPAKEVPARFGRYQIHVLVNGHVPGVLSGAELRGRSREYGDRYAAARRKVAQFAFQYGVRAVLVSSLPGRPRVWVDKDGNRVRIVLV
jgi:hypothetical protein